MDDVAIKISKKTGAAIRHMYTTEVSLSAHGLPEESLDDICGPIVGQTMSYIFDFRAKKFLMLIK